MTTISRSDGRAIHLQRQMSAPDLMRRVAFASCYVYSPSGSSAVSDRARLLRALLKAGDARFMRKYAVRVRQQLAMESPLKGFMAPTDVLVPIPGSEPRGAGSMSVAERLAFTLLQEGVGHAVWNGLRRLYKVRKSATAPAGSRPTVGEHYESFGVILPTPAVPRLILIDDVITKGRTLLAAASRVREAAPQAEIHAFALLRTMGLTDGVEQLLNPCLGVIRWSAGDAHRTP